MADTTRRVTIAIQGSDADFRIAMGVIIRQILRGSLKGEDPGRWKYEITEED